VTTQQCVVHRGRPVLGVIHQPFAAGAVGSTATSSSSQSSLSSSPAASSSAGAAAAKVLGRVGPPFGAHPTIAVVPTGQVFGGAAALGALGALGDNRGGGGAGSVGLEGHIGVSSGSAGGSGSVDEYRVAVSMPHTGGAAAMLEDANRGGGGGGGTGEQPFLSPVFAGGAGYKALLVSESETLSL